MELPHNRDLELRALATTIAAPDWMRGHYLTKMRPEFFHHSEIRELWEMSAESASSPEVLYDRLWEKRKALRAFLSRDDLMRLCQEERALYGALSENAEVFDKESYRRADETIERLERLWQRREAIKTIEYKLLPGLRQGIMDPNKCVEKLARISTSQTEGYDPDLGEVADEVIGNLVNGMDSSVVTAFGMPQLDRALRGLRRDDFFVVAGPQNCGKSVLVQNLVLKRSAMGYGGVLIFSLEMVKANVTRGLLSMHTKIPADFFTYGYPASKNRDEAVSRVASAMGEFNETFSIYDQNIGKLSETKFEAIVTQESAKYRGRGSQLDCVVLDYLQLLGSGNDEITGWTRFLKGFAQRVQVPIICVSSFSRAYERRLLDTKKFKAGKGQCPKYIEPSDSDLRDSGNIEYDASKIGHLLYSLDGEGNILEDERYFIQSKNKYGPARQVIKMGYNQKTLTFTEA